jgi:threonine aldolase
MNFESDNIVGASPPVLDALVRANAGPLPAYGADPLTAEVEARFREIFERDCAVFLVTTGTAANALALAAAVPPYGLALCHREAHVIDDECGAPEFFTHGAKLVGLAGVGGKLAASDVEAALAGLPASAKQMPPCALSLSQVTECGTVYTLDEIRAHAEVCGRRGLKLHMDGARFANALVRLGCSPADMTWRSGVDILSFGATKNGCLMGEAVVVFDAALAGSLAYRRKRAGQTLSKGRLVAAQLDGYFADGHWIDNARRANGLARRLSEGLAALPGIRLAWPTEANEVFPILPRRLDEALRAAGARYHPWSDRSLAPEKALGPDESLVRLVCSFATPEAAVEDLLNAAAAALRRPAAE